MTYSEPGGMQHISIHALREEGDIGQYKGPNATHDFYPRPPRGGRPFQRGDKTALTKFLSTPSARRATVDIIIPQFVQKISIHALREEGDRLD